MYRVKDQYF